MFSATDKFMIQKLNQRLARLGGAQSKIAVSSTRGDIMVSGTIEYEMQRRSILRVVTSVPGVRRVIDQLTLKPKVRRT